MKKVVLFTISLLVATVVMLFTAFNSVPQSVKELQPSTKTNKVVTVTSLDNKAENDKVLQARFLNMLNRNFVYDSSFDTVETVVNNSVVALLDMRDSKYDSFISQSIVSGFVYDMYGIDVDYSLINTQFPQKDGYLYIIPRGYDVYSHNIVSMTENEDGTYTVKTNVKISTHGGNVSNEVCETLFVKNSESQFGFNIVFSNICASTAEI